MIKRWLTFGLSPEQEDRFRSSTLPGDLAQARMTVPFVLLLTVAFAVNDYLFLGLSWQFYLVLGLRLALIASGLWLLRSMRGLTSYRVYDRNELAWALVMVVVLVAIAATRPETFIVHAMVAALAVFATLLLIPNWFANQLVVAVAIIVGETLVLVPGLRASPQSAVTVVASMVLTGGVATAGSWQLHYLHRRGFLAREEERKAKAEAERQLAERERAEAALHDSEARLRALFAAMNDVILVVDAEGRYLEVAPTKPDLLYRPAEEVLGRRAHEIFPAEQADYFVEQTRQALEASHPRQIEYSLPIGGQDHCFAATISPLSADTAMVVARDITALVEQRTLLVAAERARADLAEHLNEEINHRARNNLAMVSGLLQMQVLQEPNPQVAARLREAIARIRSFVDIHEKIYATGAEEANLLEVIRQVATTVRAVFSATAAELSVEGNSGVLPTRAVTNLAVMTNELITNALKHGGAGAGGGVRVKVCIDRVDGRVRISVWNSGPPVPDGFDVGTQQGMGLRLVTTFAQQYGGSFQMRPAEGGTMAELAVAESELGQ